MEPGRYLGAVMWEPHQYVKVVHFAPRLLDLPKFEYWAHDDLDRPGWWDSDSEGPWECTHITHWMSLPELPEEN